MFFRKIVWVLISSVTLVLASCKRDAVSSRRTGEVPTAPAVPLKNLELNGIVMELKADGKTIVIAHEEVTNYMPAMTMPFEVRNAGELRGLKPGDAVHFQMVVSDYEAWIAHITKRDVPPAAAKHSANALPAGVRILRDEDPLAIGDVLPEYHFTNELGRVISTAQFKGQPFALTFFFTRCPYPAYCPLLSSHFEETQKKLLADPRAPAHWHLFSISFDVENDPPGVLKSYAAHYNYDPAHWSFLTGDPGEIKAIAWQVGAYFDRDDTGGISHNLRTVVIDATGRVQKVWGDNQWSAADLEAELIKGAKVKP